MVNKKKDKQDKPENYLGPGYYEYKGGFDANQNNAAMFANKNINAIPISKSC